MESLDQAYLDNQGNKVHEVTQGNKVYKDIQDIWELQVSVGQQYATKMLTTLSNNTFHF